MTNFSEKTRFEQISVWIQEGIVLLVYFFFLFYRVNPLLIIESQPPVFLKGVDFLSRFLRVPGGMTDWLSALFMQFWFSNFLSSMYLTICLWMVALLTRKWIEVLTQKYPSHTFHLIPAGLLLLLHSQYNFHLNITLALIINLSLLNLFSRWIPRRLAIRITLGVIISVLLYWITGGAFLIFTVLCGLDDLLNKKQLTNGLVLLIISIILPIVASTSVFLITLKQAFLHNQVFEDLSKLWIIECSVPAFYLLVFLIAFLGKFAIIQKPFKRIFGFPYIWKLGVGLLFLIGCTFLLEQKLSDDTLRLVLQVNKSVRENCWPEVLKSVQRYPNEVNPLLLYQTNLSLFQMGMLLDKMFAYNQTLGTVGLLMDYEWCTAWPEEASNVYWKLGLISESQHWAHEAFEYKGYTPDLIKRLGMIYMLKGNNEAANRYFLNLKNIPFQREVAENLIRLNANPSEIAQDSTFKQVQLCMPIENLVYRGGPSSFQLELLLKRNPKNKMAFEYLMAYYLLNGDLKEIWNNIPNFNALGYSQFPRYVQEALIFRAALIQKSNLNLVIKRINPFVFKHFLEFRKILLNQQGNKSIARQYLQKQFGDTYWYYFMFIKPAPKQPESQP